MNRQELMDDMRDIYNDLKGAQAKLTAARSRYAANQEFQLTADRFQVELDMRVAAVEDHLKILSTLK